MPVRSADWGAGRIVYRWVVAQSFSGVFGICTCWLRQRDPVIAGQTFVGPSQPSACVCPYIMLSWVSLCALTQCLPAGLLLKTETSIRQQAIDRIMAIDSGSVDQHLTEVSRIGLLSLHWFLKQVIALALVLHRLLPCRAKTLLCARLLS